MANGVTIDLIVDPKKAIEGIGQVESKATGMSDTLGKLGGVAAKGVAVLGTAAVGASVGLIAASKSAGEYAENVQLTASKTHLSTKAVQELQYAAKVTHVDMDTMTGSMTKLTKSMGAAQGGTGAQAEAFKKLGVATTDTKGNLLDSTKVYAETIEALGKVKNPAERDVLAMQLLGKSATQLNPLIDGSAGSMKDLAAQADASGSVLSGSMLEGLGGLDDAFDKLELGGQAAKNALGLTLMPVLTELGDQGSGLLGQFTTALVSANGDIGKAAPAIGSVVQQGLSFLLAQLPKLVQVGSSIVLSIIGGITTALPSLIRTAVPILISFVTSLLGELPLLLNAGVQALLALVRGIAAALPQLIPAAITAILGLVTALVNNLPLLINAGIQLLLGLALGLVNALPQLVAQLPKIIIGLITGLIRAIPQLIEAGVQLLVALVKNLPAIIKGIIAAVPAIINALVKTLGDPKFWKALGDAGLQLIKGLWEGIKGAGDWLWKQLSGFFGGVIKNIKNLFGIHSPSTVFAEFGDNMIAGLVKGIQGGYGLVTDTMGDLSSTVTDGFQSSLAVDAKATVATTGGVSGGGGTVIVNYNALVPSAEGGRAVVNALQQYVAGGGRGLGAVLGG